MAMSYWITSPGLSLPSPLASVKTAAVLLTIMVVVGIKHVAGVEIRESQWAR